MKDTHKNMIALFVITIIVVMATEYYKVSLGLFWLILIGSVAVWLIVTPFKLYDDAG